VLNWIPVCSVDAVPAGSGVAVLLPDAVQVAVYRCTDGELNALSNVDPFSGAAVLARGIVGDSAGIPTVASPVYKQRFALRTGDCIDADGVRIAAYPVRVSDGWVHVGAP
jgi:nitrite reductase (NADH) small subunit